MPLCFIDFHLGVLPDHTPGQWIEASALIDGPRAFHFEARLCNRAPSGDLSQYRVSSKVEGPFTAPTILALLTLCTLPPFTPTDDSMDIFVHGDRWLTDGALARLMNPSVALEVTLNDIPRRCQDALVKQLEMASTAVCPAGISLP
ncbi:hypothetical protein N0B51_10545 [Tsuneonella sp. YG55]|uniref:Uncharacterized protein n=1 Tax=Tsuneonella litorea TaxID=2976475 RepID=A0A9X2W294_9SPHN|nr:hypothetical protein [Tsuneonella litorea]MCT2559417.1 hypothetical protein [Tsuneonella litorea]